MAKYPRYQDYVIKDGKLVGEFEQMYQDYADPWLQEKIALRCQTYDSVIEWCRELNSRNSRKLRVVELGCGLGLFTKRLNDEGFEVLGVDVSQTAIAKAKMKYPECQFTAGDILDLHLYEAIRPDVFIMAEISWYVLDKLDTFLQYLKENHRGAHLMHILTTYPKDVQQYGNGYFSDLKEIMDYFQLKYLESGEVEPTAQNNCARTYFLAQI